jgi:hypothetical protein
VTHLGFGITTQEIDQHQEEIQVNYFQRSILQFKQKKKSRMGSEELHYRCSCCQIQGDLLGSIGKKTVKRGGISISLLMFSSQ